MRSWIHHITLVNKSVRDVVRRKWGQGVAASQAVIIQLFREAIKLAPKCTLVIDGLDECTPEESCLSVADFVKTVDEAVKDTDAKILVISRKEDSIHEALSYVKYAQRLEYEVSEKDVRSDTDALSKHIVQKKLSSQTKSTKTRLAQMMNDRCKGQFLWLRLQDISLRVFENQLQPQNAVEATPADLSKLYDRNWNIITKLSEDIKSQAILLLRLAAFSLRPLTIREISDAILVCDEHEGITRCQFPNSGDIESTKRKILDLCNSFLEIRMKGPGFPAAQWTVHPIHATVKEFLIENISYASTMQKNNKLTIAAEHAMLAQLCIRHISFSQVWKDLLSDEVQHLGSFAGYALSFWHKHAEAGIVKHANPIYLERFFDETNPSWAIWRKWFDTTHDGWENAKSKPASPLCYAIELGFADLARFMIKERRVRLNCSARNRTALGVACSKGYETLVHDLLEYGAKIGLRDSQGRTALYHAASNGHLNLVKLLVDKGADITINDHDGVSPFHAACVNGHLSVMRRLIQEGADARQLDKENAGPVLKASSNGHIKAVRFLIGKGAHYELSNYHTMPPVFVALKKGSTHLVKLLIDQENDINAVTKTNKQTMLFAACYEGRADIASLLIQRGADITIQNSAQQTPLYAACGNGHVDVVKLLIQKNASIKTQDDHGRTPLFAACYSGHVEVAQLLIDKGADIMASDKTKSTPLHAAAFKGSIEIVRMLIKKRAGVSVKRSDGSVAIHIAAAMGHTETVELLIKNRSNLKLTTNDGNTPLLEASNSGHIDVVTLLLDKGANYADANTQGQTPLFVASCNGHIEVAKLLLERGADAKATDEKGQTPLFAACLNGHLEVAKLLLQKGADINAPNTDGETAVYAAACHGQVEVLRLLLLCGAEITTKSKTSWLPIHIASASGHAQIVDLLIESGSDAMACDRDQNTPLILASLYHHVDVVDVLITHGVDLDAQDAFRQTSLFIASSEGDIKLVQLLIDHCADATIANDNGQTPLFGASWQTPAYAASCNGHIKVFQLLANSKADIHKPDDEGRTPLFAACRFGHIRLAKLLPKMAPSIPKVNNDSLLLSAANGYATVAKHPIGDQADRDGKTNDDSSFMIIHSKRQHIKIVHGLIKLGVDDDVNKPDNNGITPLISACDTGHVRVVKLLLQHGADKTAAGKDGATAAEVAAKKGHTRIMEILNAHHV
ncbi:ankyrin repeat-containing domain protein [Trichoderma camerunense]